MSISTNTTMNNVYSSYMSNTNVKNTSKGKSGNTKNINKMPEMKETAYGKTVGNVKLSKEAEEYYQQLKEKFSDLDFVLVSTDEIDKVNSNPYGYASDDKTTILIDADKIERMATDENYRKKIEGVIVSAVSQLDEMMQSLKDSGQGDDIVNYGISIADDGTAKFFAVLKDANEKQKERIEARAEKKKEEKKAEEKKAEAKKAEEKYKTFTADSVDELKNLITDYYFNKRSDSILSDEEKKVGQHFDLKS